MTKKAVMSLPVTDLSEIWRSQYEDLDVSNT